MKEEFKKELEGLSPEMLKIKHLQGQKQPDIPANYFHNMQFEVLQKLKTEREILPEKTVSEKKSVLAWLRKAMSPQLTWAFGIGLVLIVAGGIFMTRQASESVGFAQLTDEEILNYIDNNIEDFDALSLLNMTDEEIFFENDLDEKSVNEYLENNLDQIDETTFENLF